MSIRASVVNMVKSAFGVFTRAKNAPAIRPVAPTVSKPRLRVTRSGKHWRGHAHGKVHCCCKLHDGKTRFCRAHRAYVTDGQSDRAARVLMAAA